MKFRVEAGGLAWSSVTGVGYYTRSLINSLSYHPVNTVDAFYFDFLKRQPMKYLKNSNSLTIFRLPLIPNKIYNKLSSVRLAPPCDVTLPWADVSIFPNYALWPTVRSRLTAVVIHDLSFIFYPEHVEEGNLLKLRESHTSYLKRVVKQATKRADFIITVSETVKNEIAVHYGLPLDRIVVTPAVVADEYFKQRSSDAFIRFNIVTNNYILHLGTIQPRKNVESIFDAYLLLPKEVRAEYSLVLAGGWGWKSDVFQRRVEEAINKGENIITTGYYDFADALALYQQATVTIMYSHYEGFGMQALESNASGTPVIAADIPVFREVLDKAALFVEPDNPQELSYKINHLLSDKKLQHELITEGTRNLERFGWQKNAELLNEYCSSLLKKSGL